MNLLIHLISDARGTLVGVNQLAMNGNPVAQPLRIHDHCPHLLRCG